MSIPKVITTDIVDKVVQDSEQVVKAFTGEFVPGEENLGEVLRRDPVAEAEILAEVLDVPSEAHDLFLLGHGIRVNQLKQRKLLEADDTSISDSIERYHRIIGELGFEKVLEIPFASRKWKDEQHQNEKLCVFWRSKGGLLLVHDTYGDHVNSCKMYFNWKPDRSKNVRYPELMSGGYYIKDKTGEVPHRELYPNYGEKTTDPEVLERERLWNEKWNREAVFAGDYNRTEALRYRLSQLEETGTFVTPWMKRPFLWLLHYDDTVDGHGTYDYEKITEERIAMLPDYVREAITPKED